MTTTESKRPTHRVFHEIRKDGKVIRDREVGAVWPRREGTGFSLKLDCLPVDFSGWLTIRVIETDEEGAA